MALPRFCIYLLLPACIVPVRLPDVRSAAVTGYVFLIVALLPVTYMVSVDSNSMDACTFCIWFRLQRLTCLPLH